VDSTYKKPFEIPTIKSQVMDKNHKEVEMDFFFDILIQPLLFVFITFDRSIKISNGLLKVYFGLILQLHFDQSFFKKVHLLGQNCL